MKTQNRILIVGAGGFMGSHFVDAALAKGWEVWAGVRQSTSRNYLCDPRIRFCVFDFDDPAQVKATIADALPDNERWDYIIYNLGATKCLNFSDFNKINYTYLRTFIEALKATSKVPEKFLYMSSLSVMGPGDEKGYTAFTENMPAMPNTRYGASKLKAEMELTMSGIPYIIFRPTGIYGPRDRDYLLMLQSLRHGVDFGAGYKRQMITFIYGPDLAQAALQALEKSPAGETYLLSEPRGYSQKEYRQLAADAMGLKHPIGIAVPLWGLRIVCAIAEKIGVARLKPSTLNRDKYNILRQRNWNVDITHAREGFGFSPATSLAEGLRESVKWYKDNGFL